MQCGLLPVPKPSQRPARKRTFTCQTIADVASKRHLGVQEGSKRAQVTGLLQRDDLARSIDDEVLRLGFEQLDILKLSISSMDILRRRHKGS